MFWGKLLPSVRYGGHLKPVTLKPVSRIFRIFRARHNPEPRCAVWWWNLRWSFGGKCFWRFSPANEARKSPSKLHRKFATNFAENFANLTLEIAGAYIFRVFVSAFSVFSAFLLCGVSSDPCFCRVRGAFRIFRIFPRIGFESLISKIRPTGFIVTGFRW